MTDRDAMIEAVATDVEGTLDGLGIHLRDEPDSQQVARSIAHSAIAAIEPFMQAREQAAREDERAKIVEWLRTFGAVLTEAPSWLNQQQGQALLERADSIERNQHRNPTP